MAVSIVSNPFGDDTNTPTSIFPPKSDTISPIVGQNNTADNTISVVDETIQAITDPAHQVQDTSTVSNDEQRLNDLHPEETIAPVVDEEKQTEPTSASIPNMYIQADRDSARMVADEAADEAVDVAIFSPEKEQADVGGFDMDDLLDDENSPMTTQEQEITATPSQEAIQSPIATTMAATAQDPFTQDVPNMPAIVVETKAPVIAPKKSLTKSLAMAAAGLFAVVVIGFIVVTMFPAGIDGPENGEEIVVQEPIIEEPEVQHTVAQEKTLQEIAREQLVDYSVLGEEYYTLARELKDRDMLRYALYVEKKTKDLIELLDLDPNMDTKDIVVYFAQFDDYLETLADWKAGLGDMIPVQTSDSSLIGDDLSQGEDAFSDIQIDPTDDTNSGSTPSSASRTESQQSELSDG